ncbi:hypothetical protein BJX96DRAFT_185343 [Aspergillus floccosus]
MELASLDLRARRPQVSWGTEQKVYLCCLFRYFEKDLSRYKQVFDLEFQMEIRQWGFTRGVPSSRLDTQWADMRSRGDPIWGYVYLSPFDMNGRWSSVLERIQIAAQTLGIHLKRKTADDTDISRFILPPRLTLSQQQIVGMTEEQTSSSPRNRQAHVGSDNFPIDNLPPSKRRDPEKLCNGGGKKCLWCLFHQLESGDTTGASVSATALETELPPLLYRWSNIDTQGVNNRNLYLSGLAAEADYFSPDAISAEEFNSFLSRHVHIDKVPSPFISTMMSLLAPLHRGIRSNGTAIVSIIDPSKLGTDSPVFSAKDLMRRMGLKVNGYYNGTGEYLVWWKVPALAIVCSFKISDLMQIVRDCPAILELMQFDTIADTQGIRGGLRRKLAKGPGAVNMDTGMVIGKLLSLLHVPSEYAPLVGEGIVFSWKMKRHGLWRDFEEGIRRGCEGCEVPAICPMSNAEEELEALEESSHEEFDALEERPHEVMSIPSGASGTVRSASPSPKYPAVTVQIFNRRTQNWVDQQLADESPPMQEGDERPNATDNPDENDEDMECISIFDTDEEELSKDDEQAPQDLFGINRARIRELFG